MTHYEIKYRNFESVDVPCILANERTAPLLKSTEYENTLVIERFNLSNSSVSLFNPELRQPIDDCLQRLGLYSKLVSSQNRWTPHITYDDSKKYWATPYCLLIKTNGTYYSTYIPWFPETPATLPYSNTPYSIATNDYFHSYNPRHFSNILTKILQLMLEACPNLDPALQESLFTVMIGGKMSLLIPKSQIQAPFSICVNYDLNRLLGFDSTKNSDGLYELTIPSTIQLISAQNFGIIDTDMCCLNEKFIPSARFPYESVVFSTNMEIDPLNYYSNVQQMNNDATMNMLTDYVFNSLDILSFYDQMSQQITATCYDRKIAVKNIYKNTQINVYLKTHDDILVQHVLKPLEYASIMIYIN